MYDYCGEPPTFLKDVKSADFKQEEREELVNFLAANPEAGVVRKVRFVGQGRGENGAYRVVYYSHSEDIPLFALALFAKNERANPTKTERNELKALMTQIVEAYKGRKK